MYKYLIRPLEHGIASQYPSVSIPGSFAPATKNVKALRSSIRKRWGYTLDRDLGAGVIVHGVSMFQLQNGVRYTIILTDKDICKRETSTGKTFSYLTPKYTTGSIQEISGNTVTGYETLWGTNVAAGDKFILDDDHTSDVEPDTNWATVQAVIANTELTLTSNYTGTTGTWTPGTKTYKVRNVYSVPSNEKWQCCSVGHSSGNYFVATNGNVPAQYWDGSTSTMQNISLDYANKARYCKSFGDRLILLDKDDETGGGTRNPFLMNWSTISNPIDMDYSDDSSAGRKSFTETADFITGVGVAGSTMLVFKRDGVHVGYATTDATWPFEFPTYRPGVGCVAPYSIIETQGTVFWLGENDFYRMEGDQPVAMGVNAVYKVYDIANETEAQNIWGFVNQPDHELNWVVSASGSVAQYIFGWDYKYNEWNMYEPTDFITAGGIGAI